MTERQISDEVCLAALRGWCGYAPDAPLSATQQTEETKALGGAQSALPLSLSVRMGRRMTKRWRLHMDTTIIGADRDELEREIERLTRERDLWKLRAEQAQAILRAHTPEQSVPDCPDHPTGRMVDDAGKRICSSCGRSS